MPKPRSKRSEIREERKRKHEEIATSSQVKKLRTCPDEPELNPISKPFHPQQSVQDKNEYQDIPNDEITEYTGARPEVQYFGFLDDQEQETFHQLDRVLREYEANPEFDLTELVAESFNYAQNRELKLACSQGFSKFLERLIIHSTIQHKKALLKAFAGNYMSLLQHRFASHICETLFIQCAPIVSQELRMGFEGTVDEKGEGEETIEELFLATLDEMEGHLDFLLTDRFGSHTLRVVLLILSGRPIHDTSTRSVVQSKSKVDVMAEMRSRPEWMKTSRQVPTSFLLAARKIISDSTISLNLTSLKVLARHPIGNPTLQLLLDLDISLSKNSDEDNPTLLPLMLPDAPNSLTDAESPGTDFIMALIFDSLGSRLLEVIISKVPGKIFKPIFKNILQPRLQTFIKNETAAYSVLRALDRVSKQDLVGSIATIHPLVRSLVEKKRFNVLTTLFERCQVRSCNDQIEELLKTLSDVVGWGYEKIIPGLFELNEKSASATTADPFAKPRSVFLPHAANLTNCMLSMDKKTRKAIHSSLAALSTENMLQLATESAATASVLIKALTIAPFTDGTDKAKATSRFSAHKAIVATLTPHAVELALSPTGHNVLKTIAAVPSTWQVPAFMKRNIMALLAAREDELRADKNGRSVWRNWLGPVYQRNPGQWGRRMKELEELQEAGGDEPKAKGSSGVGKNEVIVAKEIEKESTAYGNKKGLRPIDIARMRAAEQAQKGKGEKHSINERSEQKTVNSALKLKKHKALGEARENNNESVIGVDAVVRKPGVGSLTTDSVDEEKG